MIFKVLKLFRSIEYGTIIKGKKVRYDFDPEDYRVLSSEEVFKHMIGTCWDTCNAFYDLTKKLGYDCKKYLLVHSNDLYNVESTHAFPVLKDKDKYYPIEVSYLKFIKKYGYVLGPYESYDLALNDYLDRYESLDHDHKGSLRVYEYKKMTPGWTIHQVFHMIYTKGKRVI